MHVASMLRDSFFFNSSVHIASLAAVYESPTGFRYFVPTALPVATSYTHAKSICNLRYARLRNVKDQSFNVAAIKTYYNIKNPVTKAYSIEETNNGALGNALVVCERKDCYEDVNTSSKMSLVRHGRGWE